MRELGNETKVLINQSFHSRFSFIAAPEETWHPLTDVYETNKELIVKMELPGVDVKDIQVLLESKKLTVQGVRTDPAQNEKTSYHRMEINYGPFRRIVLLPVSVRTKEAKARYTNGFLEVKLPFSDEMSAELMVITID